MCNEYGIKDTESSVLTQRTLMKSHSTSNSLQHYYSDSYEGMDSFVASLKIQSEPQIKNQKKYIVVKSTKPTAIKGLRVLQRRLSPS